MSPADAHISAAAAARPKPADTLQEVGLAQMLSGNYRLGYRHGGMDGMWLTRMDVLVLLTVGVLVGLALSEVWT